MSSFEVWDTKHYTQRLELIKKAFPKMRDPEQIALAGKTSDKIGGPDWALLSVKMKQEGWITEKPATMVAQTA